MAHKDCKHSNLGRLSWTLLKSSNVVSQSLLICTWTIELRSNSKTWKIWLWILIRSRTTSKKWLKMKQKGQNCPISEFRLAWSKPSLAKIYFLWTLWLKKMKTIWNNPIKNWLNLTIPKEIISQKLLKNSKLVLIKMTKWICQKQKRDQKWFLKWKSDKWCFWLKIGSWDWKKNDRQNRWDSKWVNYPMLPADRTLKCTW